MSHVEPRTLRGILSHYLRDLVYGANDGIITTFAVVAGVAGAELAASVVLVLGVANLVADGFSMGASNYLSIRSDEQVRSAAGLEAAEPHAFRHGVATFVAFLLAGVIPLLAYIAPLAPGVRFGAASVLTLLALFGVGASRAVVTARAWWRSGLEMFVVGAAAAAVAYALGAFLARVVGVTGHGPV